MTKGRREEEEGGREVRRREKKRGKYRREVWSGMLEENVTQNDEWLGWPKNDRLYLSGTQKELENVVVFWSYGFSIIFLFCQKTQLLFQKVLMHRFFHHQPQK